MTDNLRKVYLSPSETGWVARGTDGLWRVSNVPVLATRFNLDDVVEFDAEGTLRGPLHRRWPLKSLVVFSRPDLWVPLSHRVRTSGMGWTEGWGRCRCGVAHDERLTLAFLRLTDPGAVIEPLSLEPLCALT